MIIKNLYRACAFILSTLLIGLRPILGPAQCKYQVGCTQFAMIQFEEQPLHRALINICKRLLSCNPFVKGS